jgi:hypothetical protein
MLEFKHFRKFKKQIANVRKQVAQSVPHFIKAMENVSLGIK